MRNSDCFLPSWAFVPDPQETTTMGKTTRKMLDSTGTKQQHVNDGWHDESKYKDPYHRRVLWARDRQARNALNEVRFVSTHDED
jgi:hypothetical protein